jgi:hypothetical protein
MMAVEALAGLSDAEIDAALSRAADDEIQHLVGELAGRLAGRLSPNFGIEGFVLRLEIVELRDLYERDVEFRSGVWRVLDDVARAPNVVSRWQGLAALVRCENEDLRAQTPVLLGLCQVEGAEGDLDAVARALAQETNDPLGRAYLLRALPDRELLLQLQQFDIQALLHAVSTVGAEVAQLAGGAARLDREIVTHFEVAFEGTTYCTQTVSNAGGFVVHDEVVGEPTITIRIRNAVDFARICTGEATLIELIAGGRIEVVGDLTVFAQIT